MAFTFVQSDSEAATGTSTTVAEAMVVTGGNLIVAWVKHEGAATTITMSDGTSSLTAATKTSHANNDVHGQFFYLLSANNGNKTFTATFAATRPFRSLILWEFSHANGPQFDAENGASGTTLGTSVISSGNFTTTAADTVALGGYAEYSSLVTDTERCNDLAATAVVRTSAQANFTVGWYRIFSSIFTGDVDCNLPGASEWIVRGIAFRDGAAAPTFSPELMGPQKKRYPILDY